MRRISLFIIAIITCFYLRAQQNDAAVRFTWGASFAGSIDLSHNDMSAMGIDAFFGMRTLGVQALGFGASMNVPVNNSYRTIPIYAMVRTNFSTRPTLCFLDLRGGVAINYLEHDITQAGAYASGGIGVNLAGNDKFRSYLILGYSFFDRKPYLNGEEVMPASDLHMATIRLGISF